MHSLNEFYTDTKFAYEPSKESIEFLDLKVSAKNSKIITDLYVKSTDRHQYLQYLSTHPNHTKRSVVFSKTLCISRLCSYEENFVKHKANMKSWFLKKEYLEKLISAEMDKVKFFNIERKSNGKTQKGILLVVTYHPMLKSLSRIVNNNIYLLHTDQEVKRRFTPEPEEKTMQSHLYEHFQLSGHTGFLQDTYVTFIDKTDPRAPTKHEDYWVHTLKTKAPMGLNVEDGY